ncbi:hypothetical protein NWP96_00965 [Mycoplasmopsis cynos]|nr:hypothetical protein [Mycoplasmopsis cynos]
MKKLDELNINELVTIFNNSTLDIYKALEKVQNDLEIVSGKISNTIKNKGRVIYVGAGSSGRIGLVDALDVIPTFNEREWFKYSMVRWRSSNLKFTRRFRGWLRFRILRC